METKCVYFDMCKNIHPTGMKLRADGWGLQGELGKGFKAICPECLERIRVIESSSERANRTGV